MAIQVLANGTYGDGVSWSIDWDNTGRTIGITMGFGPASDLFVEVAIAQVDVVADCLHGPASGTPDPVTGYYRLGDIRGAGRTVVVGPGSVIGHTAPVNSINWKSMSVGVRWAP